MFLFLTLTSGLLVYFSVKTVSHILLSKSSNVNFGICLSDVNEELDIFPNQGKSITICCAP